MELIPKMTEKNVCLCVYGERERINDQANGAKGLTGKSR